MVSPFSSEQRKKMTFWSRYDAVAQPRGNTDHWTKLKQRAVQHKSLSNPDAIGKPITLDGKHTRLPCGRVQNLSEKLFDDFIVDALQGNMPGTYMYTRPRNTPNKGALRNSFNERAKDGFRYWLIDRPKPTSFGKYGIGSYKTVIGVGNAPRT